MGKLETHNIDHRAHPRVNSADPVAPRPRPEKPAHVIKSDAEAIEIATRLAAEFAKGAALRDREGLLPIDELDAYSQSGLWSINVPYLNDAWEATTLGANYPDAPKTRF